MIDGWEPREQTCHPLEREKLPTRPVDILCGKLRQLLNAYSPLASLVKQYLLADRILKLVGGPCLVGLYAQGLLIHTVLQCLKDNSIFW